MIKRRFVWWCVAVLVVGLAVAWWGSVHATVISVHDGDTLTVRSWFTSKRVIRLLGVDAPELKQPFGIASRDALRARVLWRTVRLKTTGQDRFSRTVGRVFVDGEDVNLWLVRQGWARWYRQYARDDHALDAAEREARLGKLGLWAPAPRSVP